MKGWFGKKCYFELFFSARPNCCIHQISYFSDPPFTFFANNFANIWQNIKNQIFILNLDPSASSRGKIIVFRSIMGKKRIFTFENFQNLYWHGKQHSALVAFIWIFLTVRFQMCSQIACLRKCFVTLVAFVWFFSIVSVFHLDSENVIAFTCIITFKMFIHLHCDKCGEIWCKLRKI